MVFWEAVGRDVYAFSHAEQGNGGAIERGNNGLLYAGCLNPFLWAI